MRELLMLGLAACGVSLMVRGVAMWSVPAAWILTGVVLALAALWPLLRLRLR